MNGEKRQIRFKEWGLYVDEWKTPIDERLQESDGTLERHKYRLRTDNNGFIRTGNELENAGGLRKIALLGDSFVESLYSDEDMRFASQVERNLLQSGRPFQLWNLGYSGATLLHSFNVFMNKLVPLLEYVEQVLIFTAMSDQRTLTRKRSYWIRDATHAPLIENSNGFVPEDQDPSYANQRVLLKLFIQAVREFGSSPVVVLTPFRNGSFVTDQLHQRIYGNQQNFDRQMSLLTEINENSRDVAESVGCKVFDAASHLDGRPEYFYDHLHLNSLGKRVMSRYLTDEILSS